ncbi:uncharacterized protein BT62DRAFT_949902 [Guyanagaster necrorhizus]|uniref:Uncharacterized protein n=1 Tax=Guyanagaster necrorhizus TaxID=856835 RepID=A0A9P8AS22_9AGAR|nr:uncharacterized protein BT62DRAFT_949902 [Guyanagaster necrorhizus MCA 3950]KAG7445968.1 hypothetical protein BT62DRAFT_949902 [Guyanagaster necrorhizus MCA 3950]
MTKPTLVQSLLGRPSQTYSFPQDKHYYSSKAKLLRLAEGDGGRDRYIKVPHDEEKRKRKRSAGHSQSMNLMRTEVTHKSNNDNNANLDVSSLPTATSQQPPSVVVLNDTTSDEDDDDEHDIFYTPNSSPNPSMASTIVAPVVPFPANAKVSRPVKTEIAIAVPSTRTPASRSTTSLSSTVATSLDGHSLFSAESSPVSECTRLTTPLNSDSGHEPPRRLVRSNSPHTKRSYTYTDEDWAKDVRWLVMPEGESSRSTKTPLPRTKPKVFEISRSEHSTPSPRNHSISHVAKVTPSIMMSMTALLEEDEDRDGRLSRLVHMNENPRSSVLISHPRTEREGSSSRHRTRQSESTPYRESPLRTSHQRHSSLDNQLKPATRSSPLPESIFTSRMPSMPSQGTPGFTSLTLPRAPPPPFASGSGSGNRASMFGVIGAGDGKVDLTKSGIAQTTMASIEVVRGLSGSRGFGGILGRKESIASRGRGKQRSTDAVLGFTSYRAPPTYVPSGSVLVQVWSVGIDAIDARLVGSEDTIKASKSSSSMSRSGSMTGRDRPSLMRTVSLRTRLARTPSHQRGRSEAGVDDRSRGSESSVEVGFVPGRSFVGRVLECGWEVREEVARKGDWVIGLLDVRKCGALQEFVVVDRHRIYKVPHPRMRPSSSSGDDDRDDLSCPPFARPYSDSRDSFSSRSVVSGQSLAESVSHESSYLSPSELALLPLCGVAAYRAVRTFVAVFSSATLTPSATAQGPLEGLDLTPRSPSNHGNSARRRALVLRGHDGIGAMAVQMLVRRGWRISVHASMPSFSDPEEEVEYMKQVENRVRSWGGEEVVFDDGDIGSLGEEGRRGAVVRVIERLVVDGDAFDAVLDTVGGKAIWEMSERLLSGVGTVQNSPAKKGPFGSLRKRTPRSKGQFTTLVGDVPERTIPSAGDHFKAGIRSLKNSHKDEGRNNGKVGYAWVSVAQDIDWDGDDVRESIGSVLRLALKEGIRPRVGGDERIVSFEKTPSVFVEGGPLEDGGTIVVKVVD